MKKTIILLILIFLLVCLSVYAVNFLKYLSYKGKIYDCGLTDEQIESKQAITAEETIRQYIYWSNQRHPASRKFASSNMTGLSGNIQCYARYASVSFMGEDVKTVIVNPTKIELVSDEPESCEVYFVEMEVQPYISKKRIKDHTCGFIYVETLDNGKSFRVMDIASGP